MLTFNKFFHMVNNIKFKINGKNMVILLFKKNFSRFFSFYI